jgi:hypothetical protein
VGKKLIVNFIAKLDDRQILASLYSVTPPRASASADRIKIAVNALAQRTDSLNLDGLIVYDVQDEQMRTQLPRPFPFLPTLPSIEFSKLLLQSLATPPITYRCIAGLTEADWIRWLNDAASSTLKMISLVGRASSRDRGQLTLPKAFGVASEHPGGFILGGVVIPERHAIAGEEVRRLAAKSNMGCKYFVSQAVYNADHAVKLLRDYDVLCSSNKTSPSRIFLTFTPCGHERTLQFMRWLGISIPDHVANRILQSSEPLAESVLICTEIFTNIINVARELSIPIGINVESVSIRRDEIDGAIYLQKKLADIGSSLYC